MEYSVYSTATSLIKQRMKLQKMTYARLSFLMKVPESTLKKWFLAQDGSLNNLSRICSLLGADLYEILLAAKSQEVRTFAMSASQQEHFLKDETAFEIYWLLVYERLSVSEIEQKLNLSSQEVLKRLLKLDRLKLIQLNPDEKILNPKLQPVRWSPEGPFMKKIYRKWINAIVDQGLLQNENDQLKLQFFQLSKSSMQELQKDLLVLEEKYARRTIQEMRVKEIKPEKIRFLCVTAKGSFL